MECRYNCPFDQSNFTGGTVSLGSPSYSGVEGDAVNITVQLTRVATDIPIYVLLSTADVSAEGT